MLCESSTRVREPDRKANRPRVDGRRKSAERGRSRPTRPLDSPTTRTLSYLINQLISVVWIIYTLCDRRNESSCLADNKFCQINFIYDILKNFCIGILLQLVLHFVSVRHLLF